MSAEHQAPVRPTAEGILPTASRSDRPLFLARKMPQPYEFDPVHANGIRHADLDAGVRVLTSGSSSASAASKRSGTRGWTWMRGGGRGVLVLSTRRWNSLKSSPRRRGRAVTAPNRPRIPCHSFAEVTLTFLCFSQSAPPNVFACTLLFSVGPLLMTCSIC